MTAVRIFQNQARLRGCLRVLAGRGAAFSGSESSSNVSIRNHPSPMEFEQLFHKNFHLALSPALFQPAGIELALQLDAGICRKWVVCIPFNAVDDVKAVGCFDDGAVFARLKREGGLFNFWKEQVALRKPT